MTAASAREAGPPPPPACSKCSRRGPVTPAETVYGASGLARTVWLCLSCRYPRRPR